MNYELTKEKKDIITERFIKIILISLTLLFISMFTLVSIETLESLGNYIMENIITMLNVILASTSILGFYIFYKILKDNNIFYMSQYYVVVTFEYIMNLFINKQHLSYKTAQLSSFLLFNIYKAVVLLAIVFPSMNIYEKLCKNKKGAALVNFLMSLLICVYEIISVNNRKFFIYSNVITCIRIIFFFIQSYLIIKLIKKSLIENRVLYSVFSLSIGTICGGAILQFNFYPYEISYNISLMLTLFSFIILIVGLFMKLILVHFETRTIEHDLEMFYNAAENNKSEYVLIFNVNREIIYLNKILRDKMNKNKWNNEEMLNKLGLKKTMIDIPLIKNEIWNRGCYETIIESDDGSVFTFTINKIYPQNTSKFIIYLKDITESYKINEAIKISESKHKAVMDNIMDLIISVTDKGIITFVNKSTLKTLGYDKNDKIIGVHYEDFMLSGFKEIRNFVLSGKDKSQPIKFKLKCKNGEALYAQSIFKKIICEDGSCGGYLGVCRNLTLKEEMKKLKTKYEVIKETDKSRIEFFANISHEVRTPINIIYSTIQLLHNQKANGADKFLECYNKYEKGIKQNILRILRLVNNIIDVTNIKSNYVQMDFCNYDIVMLVEDITMSVVNYVEAYGIDIMFDTTVEEHKIKCAPEQMERVILNLISNAIKFTDKGGKILVDIKISDKWVDIRVKDTGIGVPENMKTKIFKRFVQGDKSLNRNSEGSGIGLALVKSIVESHEGVVMVEETSTKGSVFLVKLPNIVMDESDLVLKKGHQNYGTLEKIGIEFSDIYRI
ncbi:MAG: PAS domain-containing sensor histidine kinase [Clostridiaceae bacterium]|nr:PAS domain-containing sensor histidine kinase [Clostridiaceae bacterium]